MNHSYIDEYSKISSFFNRLDARVKVISLFLLLISIIFNGPDEFTAYAYYGIIIVILILLSRIPVSFIIKKSLVIIPFILMAVIFSPFANKLDGPKIRFLCGLSIKTYLSALCMILLIASTNFSLLLKALEKLKLPSLITMIISFMYRYVFVVQDEIMKMLQAKDSRSVFPSVMFNIRALSSMLGVLFIRTYERAESVYLAMCSRGYDGSIRTLDNFRLNKKDIIFLVLMCALMFGKIIINLKSG